jgi:hypothetical protein
MQSTLSSAGASRFPQGVLNGALADQNRIFFLLHAVLCAAWRRHPFLSSFFGTIGLAVVEVVQEMISNIM